jgi:hypothetical protein
MQQTCSRPIRHDTLLRRFGVSTLYGWLKATSQARRVKSPVAQHASVDGRPACDLPRIRPGRTKLAAPMRDTATETMTVPDAPEGAAPWALSIQGSVDQRRGVVYAAERRCIASPKPQRGKLPTPDDTIRGIYDCGRRKSSLPTHLRLHAYPRPRHSALAVQPKVVHAQLDLVSSRAASSSPDSSSEPRPGF